MSVTTRGFGFRALGAAIVSVCALTGALASSLSAPAPLPPPYEGVYQPEGVDEVGLWQRDDESERALANSPHIIRDEKLTRYVHDLLCRTVGDDRCKSVRTYIIREPSFNATMSPNGTMRVFSGLLLRARSEAELASVLGHEFGHFENRHSLQHFRARRRGTDILSWSSLLVGIANTRDARRTHKDLRHSVYGGLYRYGRDQEREADLLGLGYMNTSALRPQAAAEIWQSLMREQEESAAVRGRKKPDFDRVAFFASHPPKGERVGYLAALAIPEGAGRDNGAAQYREAVADWLPLFLEDQIKLNDFGGTEYIIANLAADGWTADLHYARGELFRARGNPRDMVHAADFFRSALDLDNTLALAHRGLGLSLFRSGKRAEGVVALKAYLELAPDAEDAGMIGMMIPKDGEE